MSGVIDEYLQRYLRLVRVAEGESIRNVKIISKTNDKIIEMFERTFSKKRITTVDLNALRVNVNNIVNLAYSKNLVNKLTKDLDDLIKMEFEWHKNTFKKIGFGERILTPDQQIVVRNSLNRPYQGKTFTRWFGDAGALHANKINKIINAGITTGANNDKIIQAVANVSKLPKSHVATLTRSAIMTTMNDVKSEFFDENKDLMDGKMWLSTLDFRTTVFICGPRDGLKYTVDNEPIGHDLPWDEGPGRIHFNCRSTWVPLIDGFSITAPRAAIVAGENYERGSKYTRGGKIRKNTAFNRDKGIIQVEQVTSRTKFEGWLRRQPTDYVSDTFGNVELAKRFKKGESLADLYESKYGRPLTVSTL
jgi:hypothetical protein